MTNFDKTNTLSSLVSFFPQSNSDKTCSRQQIASEVSQFCSQPLHSAAFCALWNHIVLLCTSYNHCLMRIVLCCNTRSLVLYWYCIDNKKAIIVHPLYTKYGLILGITVSFLHPFVWYIRFSFPFIVWF